MTDLIQKVRVVLKYMSKAKAAKLVRGLVDMFLEMKTANQDDNGELGVQVCKVSTMKVCRDGDYLLFYVIYGNVKSLSGP